MAFQGNVAHIPLSNIVQALILNGQGGVLSVRSNDLQHELCIHPLGVRPLASDPRSADLLCYAVVKEGLMSEGEFRNALSTWDPSRGFPGDFLVKRRVITAEQVRGGIRRQLEELLFEIFTVTDLSYQFSPERDSTPLELFDPEGLGVELLYSANGLMMEAARRADDWRRINAAIPSCDEIFVPEGKRLPESLPKKLHVVEKVYRELRPLLTGERTIRRIVRESSRSRYEVLHCLFTLKCHGVVKSLDLKKKKELAERFRRTQRTRDAIDVYASIVSQQPENTRSRLSLVSLLEKASPKDTSLVAHYLALCDQLAGDDPSRAAEYAGKALRLDPDNLEAHRKIFYINARAKDRNGALAAVRDIVRVCKSTKRYEEGAEFLEQVLKSFPTEVQLLHEMADLRTCAGQNDKAIESLKSAAQVYQKNGDYAKLLKTYELVALLDPAETARLRKITSAYRKKKRSWRDRTKFAGVTIGTTFLLLVAGYVGFYEYVSRSVYAEVSHAVELQLKHGQLDRAQREIDDFLEVFPLTTCKVKITDLSSKVREAAERRREEARFDEEQLTAFIMETASRAGQLIKERRLSEAYQALNVTLRKVPVAEVSPENRDRIARLRERHDDIRSYLTEAQQLKARAEELAKEVDPERIKKAHDIIKDVLKRYPDSPAAHSAKLPVLVVSKPRAQVEVQGKPVGRSPLVAWLEPRGTVSLRVKQPGFRSTDVDVHPFGTSSLGIHLEKDLAWSFDTDGPIEGFPVASKDSVVVTNRNGRVYCIDRHGALRWLYTVPERSDLSGGLGIWKTTVYLGSYDGHVYLLDSESGELTARLRAANGPIPTPIKDSPSSATSTGTAAFNCGGRQLVGVSLLTRTVQWRYPSTPSTGIHGSFLGPPQAEKGIVYSFTMGGYLLGLDQNTGKLLSTHWLGGPLNHTGKVVGGTVFVALGSGVVKSYRVGADNEVKILWHQSDLEALPSASPTVGPDMRTVVFPLGQGKLVCMRADDGKVRWTAETSGPIEAEGVIAGDEYFVGTKTGEIQSWNLSRGVLEWRHQTRGAEQQDPRGILCRGLVSANHLFVGSDDGVLYCLKVR